MLYCSQVNDHLKIYIAVGVTFLGLAINVIYWIILYHYQKKKDETLTEALNPQEVEAEAKEFESKYQEFMTFIQY